MLQDLQATMVYDVEILAFTFAILATLAVIVKNERRLKRWLLRGRRRLKKPVARADAL